MKAFLLIDEFHDHYYDFVAELSSIPLNVVRPSRNYKKKQLAWVDGCFKVIKETSKGDTIICTLDIQAIICSWICTLFFIKRKIVCVNILLKDKDTIKNRVVSFLYKKAITRNNLIASVTSSEYGHWLNGKLRTNVKFFLQHDVFHPYYEKQHQQKPGKSIFCGGRNGRDWNFMLKVARSLPDVRFNLVVSKGVEKSFQEPIPSNAKIYSDVNYDRFYQLMCESLMVCLPLDTDAPAGLLVLFHAAANKKMVITTDTVVTREYIGENRGVILPNHIQQWSESILFYMNNHTIQEKRANHLLSFLKMNCSERQYIMGIEQMVNEINKQ